MNRPMALVCYICGR